MRAGDNVPDSRYRSYCWYRPRCMVRPVTQLFNTKAFVPGKDVRHAKLRLTTRARGSTLVASVTDGSGDRSSTRIGVSDLSMLRVFPKNHLGISAYGHPKKRVLDCPSTCSIVVSRGILRSSQRVRCNTCSYVSPYQPSAVHCSRVSVCFLRIYDLC